MVILGTSMHSETISIAMHVTAEGGVIGVPL